MLNLCCTRHTRIDASTFIHTDNVCSGTEYSTNGLPNDRNDYYPHSRFSSRRCKFFQSIESQKIHCLQHNRVIEVVVNSYYKPTTLFTASIAIAAAAFAAYVKFGKHFV